MYVEHRPFSRTLSNLQSEDDGFAQIAAALSRFREEVSSVVLRRRTVER